MRMKLYMVTFNNCTKNSTSQTRSYWKLILSKRCAHWQKKSSIIFFFYMQVVFSSLKIYFLSFVLHLLEIYLLVEQSQDILKANEKEVLELNGKFQQWGSLFGDGLQVFRYWHVALCPKKMVIIIIKQANKNWEKLSCREINSLNRRKIGDSCRAHTGPPCFWDWLCKLYKNEFLKEFCFNVATCNQGKGVSTAMLSEVFPQSFKYLSCKVVINKGFPCCQEGTFNL